MKQREKDRINAGLVNEFWRGYREGAAAMLVWLRTQEPTNLVDESIARLTDDFLATRSRGADTEKE